MNTLVINLFGGPGTGKSTVAAGVFSKLKSISINAEYIQEYAKDKAWEGNEFTLQCQPYITAKQLYRMHRVMGKAEVLVTDSPLIQGMAYGGKFVDDNWRKWLADTHKSFFNLNTDPVLP